MYERRIDVDKGVLFRRLRRVWLLEIIGVEMRQGPLLSLTRDAEVRVDLDQSGYGYSKRGGRFVLRIIGFGTLDEQRRLADELLGAALVERRAIRRWYV